MELNTPFLVTVAVLAFLVYQNAKILNKENHMATREDLDAAIDNLTSTFNTALADLLAKIQAGEVVTPEDFTAEITKLQAMTDSAKAADPGPQA